MNKPDYPLRFHPIYKERIWGGDLHKTRLNAEVPAGVRIGESWGISDRPEENSVAAIGFLAGRTLRALIEDFPEALLGPGGRPEQRFPLLIKFIGGADKSSLQVHPDDAYARAHHPGELGKTEMWYIVDAEPQSELLVGFRTPQTQEQVRAAIRANRVEELLNHAAVRPGDAFFLPPKRIHGIGAGILLAEVQQNSDLTYRVYDYERKDDQGRLRDLHVDQALAVMAVEDTSEGRVGLEVRTQGGIQTRPLVSDPHFNSEHVTYRQAQAGPVHSGFQVLIVTDGTGILDYGRGSEVLSRGGVLLLPAGFKGWDIQPGVNGVGILYAWLGDRG